MYISTENTILYVRGRYSVQLANTPSDIDACLRLRFNIFSQELGADLKSKQTGLDKDKFDPFCLHLMVKDHSNDMVIATTRLLTSDCAHLAGGFYSESEFNLQAILKNHFRYMEVGRTCIHTDYRVGPALPLLWQGIARVVHDYNIDHLFGCASIPYYGDSKYISSIMEYLKRHHFSEPDLRVSPHIPINELEQDTNDDVILPTLLKGYLKQGAVICGDPYWDAQFGVADVFVILDCDQIAQRYQRHFVDRVSA
jgi:putative hemolysin